MARERNARRAAELLERPLTARSVIASLLLGRHPPSAPVALLVRWCALFGISDSSARVALSRMVERGELEARRGTYELAGRVRARQGDQDFALAPALRDWDGGWRMAVVGDGPRAATDRIALRAALTRSRMVPLRDAAWVRPDNLGAGAVGTADAAVVAAQCTSWIARPAGPREEAAVRDEVLRRFAVAEHERRGRLLLDHLRAATDGLPSTEALAGAFVAGAAVAQHLRRDPLLPAELLPGGWHGGDLRTAYQGYLRAFSPAVAAWARGG